MSTITRRALLGAIAVAPAAALPAVASTDPSAAPHRAAWDKAWREYQDATAAYKADDIIFDRIHKAHAAAAPSEEMISWRAFAAQDRWEVIHRLDLDAYQRQLEEGEGVFWWGHPGAMQEKAASIDTVRRYRALREANDRWFDYDAVAERNGALCEAMCAAEDRLMMQIPAPDGSALRWKLGKLLEVEEDRMTPSWSAKYVEQTQRDIARLLGGEA
jgi:hypothetical protein